VGALFLSPDTCQVVNAVCHRKKKGGMWLWNVDLVEVEAKATKPKGRRFHRGLNKAEQKSGESFLLVDVAEEPGKWDFEKATATRACTDVFDDMDLEELVVGVWRGDFKSAKELVKFGCNDLSRHCKGAMRPALPKGKARREDVAHEATDAKLIETEQMMQNMEEAGR
jgi:hypothetical protein